MEKRSALAMLLVFAVWMGYLVFLAPKPKPGMPPTAGQQQADTAAPVQRSSAPATTPGAPALELGEQPSAAMEAVAADTVVVSSELYEYHFITRGGVMTRAWLKQYQSFAGQQEDDNRRLPVQLVPLTGSQFLQARLHLQGSSQPVELGERLFEPSTRRLELGPNNPQGTLELVHRLPGGETLRLVYGFRHDSYLIEAELHLPPVLHGARDNRLEVMLGPTLVSNEKDPKTDFKDYGVAYYVDGEVVSKDLKDLGEGGWTPTLDEPVLWGGLKSMYFLATFFVPDRPMTGLSAAGSAETRELAFSGFFPVPEGVEPVAYSVYVGPQSYQQVKALNFGLPKILEYGWVIVQPFTKISLEIMLWLHRYIANYALILVIFALLIKVVFYPLTIKSTKSQIRMQQIQPMMAEMKEAKG